MDPGETGGGGSGGGSGGGKIRTRRYHLASSKPYPRNKQGIINIVKESVKNIVPTWLQRYFRQSEEASPNEERSQEDNVNCHPAFAADITDNALEIDGRITPEPTRISLEGPSTSRSGLIVTDILTRPSLHRSHLNCTILDTPPPLSQPSTSSAFPISNSGLSLGKEMKDSTSQHDDDNISTTSGFSSRASDKDISVSKSASVPPVWSSEAERSITHHPTATSLKKPGFNLSAFGALSPSLGSTSVLKTSQLGNSPFYPGKTTYGGAAAAARQSKARITPYQTPIRRQMKAKQVNAQSYGVTSSTARRILQSLEKMSSPLADAKRIPSSVSSSLSSPAERSPLNVTDFHSPRKRAESQYPPVQKLVTPKAISLSMSRSQYFKPSLTSSTESRRIRPRIEVNHEGVREKNLPEQQRESLERTISSPKLSTSASNGLPPAAGSGGGKMRRERGVHYISKSAREEEEEMEVPVLPEISLPISTSSLPNFSFGPLSTTTPSPLPVSSAQSVPKKVQPASNASSPVFRFSSPIVKSTEAEQLPPMSIGSFKFSVPVVKSSEPSGPKDTPVIPRINAAVNNISGKRDNDGYDGPFKPAKVLKEGSVLDILKSPGFASPTTYSTSATPPVTTSTVVYTRPAISGFSAAASGLGDTSKQTSAYWQCEACLVENKATDSKCIACQKAKVSTSDGTKHSGTLTPNITIKSVVSTTGTQGFGDKFKTAAGTWDCDTCLVQNKPEATKCVACETPKPGTGVKPALLLPAATENTATVSSSSSYTDTSVTLGFGDKFKKPKGAWECSVCLVSNKAEDSKCVACQSDKPGGSVPVVSSNVSCVPSASGSFVGLDKFKKPEGSWDCETCLVQNKADATKCVACESAKPGSKAELKGLSTATSAAASSAPSAHLFKFGIQSSSSETPQTLGSTGKDFKFGEPTGFKFGIPSDLGGSASSMTGGFKISKTEGSTLGNFPAESKSEDSSKESKSSSSFTFGLPSGATSTSSTGFQFGIASLGQQEKKEGLSKPAVGSFSFGVGSATSSENKTGISGFKFGNAEEKEGAATPFSFKNLEGKKDEIPSTKGGFGFGSVESVSAPQLVSGRTDDKQETVAPSYPSVFGKKAENEEAKPQSIFTFGKVEQTKDDGTAKPVFGFSLAKPAEKETEPPTKTAFIFGAQANPADPGSAKPAFGFLNSSPPNPAVPSVSACSSRVFSGITSASNLPPTTFLFGQASNTVSSSAFGNPSDSSTSQSFGFSQESKPPATTSSTSTPVPFLFGTAAATNSTTNSGFSFAAAAAASTTTASSTGSSSSFVFGSGSSASATGPAFGASQTPTFGQSQGSSQPPAPTFGSLSSSASSALFSAGAQSGPPAFGSVSSTTHPPVFGQQATQQPGFGSGTTPSSGPVFQFGSSSANFNFVGSNPGVFTFGAPPGGAPAQPAGSSGFSFAQSSAFNLGSNGKNIFSPSGSSQPGRKFKTAVRRRK